MALINCPDCGTEVSDAAPACPKCGRPIASPAPQAYVRDRGRRTRSTTTFTITFSSFVLIVLAIAAAVWFVPPLEIGQNITGSCQVNGTGQGKCQFTNTGWTPGTQCVDVTLRNNQQGSTVNSGPVCSGRVWPNDTTEKNVMIVIGHTCDDPDVGMPNLGKVCTMDVRNVDSSGVGTEPPSSGLASPPTADTAGDNPVGSSGSTEAVALSADSAVAPSAAVTTSLSSPQSSSVAVAATAEDSAPGPDGSVLPTSQSAEANTAGPSFDCTQVTDAVDLTICSNTELSQLDQQMAALYFARAQSGTDPTARDEQRTWLHDRNQCGPDVTCLRKEYAARIQQLQ